MFFSMSERTPAKRGKVMNSWCAVCLCIASACYAQTTQAPRPLPDGSQAPLTTDNNNPALTLSKTGSKQVADTQRQKTVGPPVPADAPAHPATVSLRNGKLTVEANNSDLGQILRELAHLSGMTITGLYEGPRIFGAYGPGNSRDVLTDLLVGSGYNFLMVGGATDGPPRELLLTSKNNNAAALASVNSRPVSAADRDEVEQPASEMISPTSEPLGPGAISPTPSLDDQDDNTRVQRTLQRLQHQQQQQNAPQ